LPCGRGPSHMFSRVADIFSIGYRIHIHEWWPCIKLHFSKTRRNCAKFSFRTIWIHPSRSRGRHGCLPIPCQEESIGFWNGVCRRPFRGSLRDLFERRFLSFHVTILRAIRFSEAWHEAPSLSFIRWSTSVMSQILQGGEYGWTFGPGCVSCQDAVRPHNQPFTDCVAPAETATVRSVDDSCPPLRTWRPTSCSPYHAMSTVSSCRLTWRFNSTSMRSTRDGPCLSGFSLPPSLPSPWTSSTAASPDTPTTTSAPLMRHGVPLHLECARQS
jgi:hypothetical protein